MDFSRYCHYLSHSFGCTFFSNPIRKILESFAIKGGEFKAGNLLTLNLGSAKDLTEYGNNHQDSKVFEFNRAFQSNIITYEEKGVFPKNGGTLTA